MLTLLAPSPQNGQTYSNNSSALPWEEMSLPKSFDT